MESEFYFIRETSNAQKIRVALISLVVLIVVGGAVIAFTSTFDTLVVSFPQLNIIKEAVLREVYAFTPAGLFYTGFGGGLFFIPLPQELFFYYGLVKGNSILLSLLTVNAGFLLAQGTNYFIGSRFNVFFMHFVSKRKLYKARRFVNIYGGRGVFIFNALPLPAPLLTFALGIAKYNVYRLFFYTLLGTALKYVVIILFFMVVH